MILCRKPNITHAGDMWKLAEKSGLDLNSSYSYLMMAEYFSESSIVALKDGILVGFVTGMAHINKPDTIFVWQVAVDPDVQGQGVALQMMNGLVLLTDKKYMQATVTPTNKASLNLFKKLAKTYETLYDTDKGFDEQHFPDDHDSEMMVTVGPFK